MLEVMMVFKYYSEMLLFLKTDEDLLHAFQRNCAGIILDTRLTYQYKKKAVRKL